MMLLASRNRRDINIWPGFVDALASVLMVFFFMLLVFAVAQLFLSESLRTRYGAIDQLSENVHALLDELSLEKGRRASLEREVQTLTTELGEARAARDDLDEELRRAHELSEARAARAARELALREALLDRGRSELAVATAEIESRDARARRLNAALAAEQQTLLAERQLSHGVRERVDMLNRQVAELRAEIARLSAALEVSEDDVEHYKTRVDQLGERLNVALAERVEELSKFRSDFFGRLREALGDRDDIRISGDRFVFQSEVLFSSGSATLEPAGERQLDRLAEALQDIARQIPADVDWILRVDGHTDRYPIHTERFPSNWELSSARALSIVHYLIERGIPPRRLAGAGFGEFRPVAAAHSREAYAQNRRIEIKLTNP